MCLRNELLARLVFADGIPQSACVYFLLVYRSKLFSSRLFLRVYALTCFADRTSSLLEKLFGGVKIQNVFVVLPQEYNQFLNATAVRSLSFFGLLFHQRKSLLHFNYLFYPNEMLEALSVRFQLLNQLAHILVVQYHFT